VPLEKNADILICDHARKDALHGSLSWTFIDDSVKHGIIQLQDRYVIGGRSDTARPVGGGGLTKGTRTAFTHADDVFLITWLHSHSDSREGNKTYQEMAAKVSQVVAGMQKNERQADLLTFEVEPTAYLAVLEESLCEDPEVLAK
jgi:hypothetical protein